MRFDPDALAEDLHHATRVGRQVGERERDRLEREGIAPGQLYACQPEGRDGTRLAGCIKTYLPPPAGQWGMVFTAEREQADGSLVLVCLAFGIRHPQRPWQPSVYQVAHARLHGQARPD